MASPRTWGRRAGCVVTFIAVVIGWVLFRAPDIETATDLVRSGALIEAAGLEMGQ